MVDVAAVVAALVAPAPPAPLFTVFGEAVTATDCVDFLCWAEFVQDIVFVVCMAVSLLP